MKIFLNLPKPKYKGEVIYWDYSPIRNHEHKKLSETDRIIHYTLRYKLTANFHKATISLTWINEDGQIVK